jgi:hypothetical protein
MKRVDAEEVVAVPVATSTSSGPVPWRLVRLREPAQAGAPEIKN